MIMRPEFRVESDELDEVYYVIGGTELEKTLRSLRAIGVEDINITIQ